MRLFLGSILLLTLLATACSKTNSSPGLIGAWKMVDYSQGPSSPAVALPADSAVVMYLFSNNRYREVSAGAVVDSGAYVYDNILPISSPSRHRHLNFANNPLNGAKRRAQSFLALSSQNKTKQTWQRITRSPS